MTRSLLIAVALIGTLFVPASAGAHAVLTGSEPARGVTTTQAPREVVLQFSEPVEAAFGGLRVIGGDGQRVDDGRFEYAEGRKDALRVALQSNLPDGTYVATYRVISADSHPVSGGVVFNVGKAGAAPPNVESLLKADAGPVTSTALKVVRGLAYLATAVLVGGMAFLVLVWGPAARRVSVAPDAADAFGARLRQVLIGAALLGALATAAGLGLQAALASATTFWNALDPATLRALLDTNFGQAWAARLAAFVVLGVLAAFARPRRAPAVAAAVAAAALIVTPGMAGHARATNPVVLNVALDAIHVAAMAAWIGGLVVLLAVLPAATRALADHDRTRLLAAVLGRFSPLALGSVAALVATGTVASVMHLTALSELLDSDWGRLVLAKLVLVGGLVAAGAVHRRRTMPRLRQLAETGAAPGGDGRFLRTTLRIEVALSVIVLGVTAVLVGISPPAAGAGGPISIEQKVGPVALQATLDPASAGVNELHLYLLRSDGSPFTDTKELRISAALPAEGVGPIAVTPRRAGPGHYIVQSLPLVPAGAWELALAIRVSEFDQYDTRLTLAVR